MTRDLFGVLDLFIYLLELFKYLEILFTRFYDSF